MSTATYRGVKYDTESNQMPELLMIQRQLQEKNKEIIALRELLKKSH